MESPTGTFEDIVRFIGEFSHDPLGFVYAAFPWGQRGTELESMDGPDVWQRDILEDIGRGVKDLSAVTREAVASGHGIGKSALVAWIVIWALATHEDTRCVVTANTDTQLRSKTWAELAKWYRLFIGRDMFCFTATSLFSAQRGHDKTWRADAIPWSRDNPEAFAGLHNQGKRILVIFDEASAIFDEIWTVTEGAMTDRDTEIIWCVFGNPTRNQGKFFECFHKNRAVWNCKQVDSRTARISNKQQLDQWAQEYGEDSDFFRVRVKGEFPSQSENQLISRELAEAARRRVVETRSYEFAPVVIGVDPAWTGEDMLAVVLRQGLYSKVLEETPRNDNDMEVARRIMRYQDDYRADAVHIDMGYGTGVYSAGKDSGRNNWRLVSFAERSDAPQYANKRAEMWGEMKDWLMDGGTINDDRLIQELTAPESRINHAGKQVLESKDEMRRRGLPSPNIADALALTFAYPVRLTDNTRYYAARRQGKIRKAGSM